MNSYKDLVKQHPRYLLYALLHTSASGFGQTFFFSLFVTPICAYYQLERGFYGGMYGLASVVSAGLLFFTGPVIDRVNVRNFSLFTTLVAASGCFIMGTRPSVELFFVGVVLLRHGGQGLMPHISSTSIARFFAGVRGRALSIANLGFSLGEGTLPALMGYLLTKLDWSQIFLGCGVFLVVVFIPISQLLLSRNDVFLTPIPRDKSNDTTTDKSNSAWRLVLRSKYFFMVLPICMSAPGLLTGFIFYQSAIAEENNWSFLWVSSCFAGFALARVFSSFSAGPLIDRFSAKSLLPFYVIPMITGFVCLLTIPNQFAVLLFWMAGGISVGLGSTIKQAIWAEVFPVYCLGAIKSIMGPVVVFATAITPPLFGWALDSGYVIDDLLLVSILFTVASIGLALLAARYTVDTQSVRS